MKRYKYDVYENDGDYITTWNDVVSEPAFSASVNGGLGEMKVMLARNADDFGESDDVNFRNQVIVRCFDIDSHDGVIIFNGWISGYTPVLKEDQEYLEITIMGYVQELSRVELLDNGSGINDTPTAGNTRIIYTDKDLGNIMEDVIDKYNDLTGVFGKVNYETTLDQTTGANAANTQSFETTYWWGIPFIPTAESLSRIALKLKKTGSPTGNLTIEIQTDNAGVPSGTVLATTTLDVATLTTSFAEYIFKLRCQLTAGVKHHVCLKGQAAWVTGTTMQMAFESVAGEQYNYGSGSWSGYASAVQFYLKTYYGSIGAPETDVTYEFNTVTILEAINKIVEMCPAGWYWYLDANNVIHLSEYATTPDHTFYVGKDIQQIQPYKRIENVKNVAYVIGKETAGENLFRSYEHGASITAYGRSVVFITDNRISEVATSDKFAGASLDSDDEPEVRTQVVIVDSNNEQGKGFDIELLHPGNVVNILNFLSKKTYSLWGQMLWNVDKWGYDISNVTATNINVVKLEYKPDSISLELSSKLPLVGNTINELRRRLEMVSTEMNPDAATPEA